MTYCHVSAQCDKHAEDLAKQDAYERELEIVCDGLYYHLPRWARERLDIDADFIVTEAKEIIERRNKEYYE